MRILIVVSSLNMGGAQRVAANLSLGLSGSCEVDFLLNETDEITYPYKGNIIGLGFKQEIDKAKLGYQIRVFVQRLKVLRKLKKSRKYDAVCSFMDSANVANIITGRRYAKTIISVHTVLSESTIDKNYKYVVIPLVKLFYRYADTIVAVSQTVKADLINRIGLKKDNIVTIYNGFIIDDILNSGNVPLTSEYEMLFDESRVIVAVGRLNWWKGFIHLIRAMSRISSLLPDCKLLILGEGEDRPALQEAIDALGLQNNVFLMGFRDNPYNILKNADVFVLSSIEEALPSVLIEALALSCPCVSTDIPGAREIIAPDLNSSVHPRGGFLEAEYGILVPRFRRSSPGIADELSIAEHILADAVIFMLKDDTARNKYMKRSPDIRDRFGIDAMAKEWRSLFV